MFTITDKVILISGGCGGIGFEVAKELLKQNAKSVILVDINEQVGINKINELDEEFGANKAIFVKAFVDDATSFKNAFEETIKKYQQLDVVINNAGIIDEVNWRKCIDVNLKGTIEGTNLALKTYFPKYKSGNEGVIINVSSIVYLKQNGQLPVYTSTKFGIAGFTKNYGMKSHYEKYNTRILALCPGYTLTNIYNDMRDKITAEQSKDIKNAFTGIVSQGASIVAKTICKMIETAEHGKFWSIEEGIAYNIDFSEELTKTPLEEILN